MRAARLIKMVLLLQSRPSMTAGELARELEVSERTITRDAQALSEAGVPVYANRGRSGGYRLVGGYRTRLTGLARGEAEALFLSGVPGALREMGLDDISSAARLKVSAALLPSLRDAPESAAQRFHLDAPGWYQEPQTPELLPVIAEAVWDDRLVAACYLRRDAEVTRELAPYGLVLKAGVWYLCARARELGGAGDVGGAGSLGGAEDGAGTEGTYRAGTDGTYRVYRVDRFQAVNLLEERFSREQCFDLPAFWEERAAEFARSLLHTEIEVRLSPEGARRLPYVADSAAARQAIEAAGPADPADEQGRITVRLPVESEEVAYAQLLTLGPEAEVLAPDSLRRRFARAAARMTDLYG
ncbi:WYL domain-containing protein [Streptomyces sp. NPDC093085]|uniref:helix-turn-helix transcriptional regulator n=1 Tax=Streptomyces sp. NPDC093085 TaxID=3155068 RepID=UPI0034359DE2